MCLRSKYDNKKRSSESRGLDFLITYDEWCVLHSLRDKVKCGYTNKLLSLTKEGADYYPSLERVDNTAPYSYENCLWVGILPNRLKGEYIEQGKPDNKLSQEHMGIVTRIRRILNNKASIDGIFKPYKEALGKVVEEEVVAGETKVETCKWKLEKRFMKHAVLVIEEYESVGATVKIPVGGLKKKLSIKVDQVTGLTFDKVEDKWLFVIDKSKDITMDNVLVVARNTMTAMNLLTKCASLGSIGYNLNKLQEK
jgi:hypothetical protein